MFRTLARTTAALLVACSLATGVALAADVAGTADPSAPAPDAAAGGVSSNVEQLAPPPKVTAKAWLVQDALTGETVAAQDPTTPRPIASLAKLMTALVAIDRLQDDTPVKVPAAVNTLPADAAVMGLKPGEVWPAGELLRAMLVYSANDAALTLASQVGGGDVDAFVQAMNDRASDLDLTSTRFTSPTGLDVGGVESTSSPLDLVTLAGIVYKDPVARAAMSTKTLTLKRPGSGEKIVLPNRNPLMGVYDGVDGVKTGFTDQAGYMLISHQKDVDTGGAWFVVTANSSSEATRASDNAALLDWIRPFRTTVLLVEGGAEVATVPVLHSSRRVHVFACDDLDVGVRVGQRLTRQLILPEAVKPPIAAGDEIGALRVKVGTADAVETKLCSSTTIHASGWRARAALLGGEVGEAWRLGTDEVDRTYRRVTGANR